MNELVDIINTTDSSSAVGFVASIYYDYDNKIRKLLFKSKCKNGCNYCCSDYFYISEAEFYTIVYYLYKYRNMDFIKDTIERGFKQYRSLVKLYPKETQYLSAYIPTQHYKENLIKMFPNQYMRLEKPCPFLIDGRCTIYPVRPFVCRAYGTEVADYISKCNGVKYRNKFSYDKTDFFIKVSLNTFSGNFIIRKYPLFYFFTHITNTTFWNNLDKILELATNQKYTKPIKWYSTNYNNKI